MTCRIHNGRKEVGNKYQSYSVKNVLVKHGIEWNSKMVLGKSRDPEYELKKIGLKN